MTAITRLDRPCRLRSFHPRIRPTAPLRIRVGRYVGVFAKTSTGYSAHAPVVPGLAVTGDTLEETIEQLRTGIPAHLEALAQDRVERPWLYAKRQVG